MMRYGTADCGRKSRSYPLTGTKRSGANVASSKVCSEGEGRTAPTEPTFHVIPGRNYGVIMTKSFSKHQAREA